MPKPIRELIPNVIRQAAERQRAIEQLQRRWARVVGKDLAGHTKPVRMSRGTLYVQTDEPGASFVLSLEKPRLLKALKEAAGGEPIEDIVVRAGEL